MSHTENAGRRVWMIQQQQGTGLCCGIDMHYDESAPYNGEFYSSIFHRSYPNDEVINHGIKIKEIMLANGFEYAQVEQARAFAAGMLTYFLRVVRAQWS